jgi:hypothetical protein
MEIDKKKLEKENRVNNAVFNSQSQTQKLGPKDSQEGQRLIIMPIGKRNRRPNRLPGNQGLDEEDQDDIARFFGTGAASSARLVEERTIYTDPPEGGA